MTAPAVLIPSLSGLRFERAASCTQFVLLCLNPFSFRAAVRTRYVCPAATPPCLNPFSFRAAVRTPGWTTSPSRGWVLIPSLSGLRFERFGPRLSFGGFVLIPSLSGLRFELAAAVWLAKAVSLNPFSFRAAVRTAVSQTISSPIRRLNPFSFRAAVRTSLSEAARRHGVVLIPSLSGLRFERRRAGIPPRRQRLNPFSFRAAVRTIFIWGASCWDFGS